MQQESFNQVLNQTNSFIPQNAAKQTEGEKSIELNTEAQMNQFSAVWWGPAQTERRCHSHEALQLACILSSLLGFSLYGYYPPTDIVPVRDVLGEKVSGHIK